MKLWLKLFKKPLKPSSAGSAALEYIIVSIFATGIALASMAYIKTLVMSKLESFEEDLSNTEISFDEN